MKDMTPPTEQNILKENAIMEVCGIYVNGKEEVKVMLPIREIRNIIRQTIQLAQKEKIGEVIVTCASCKSKLIEDGTDGEDAFCYCPKCYIKAQKENQDFLETK